MEGRIPEGGNEHLQHFGREMETIHHDHVQHILHVVHEPREHADETSKNYQEGRINLDLTDQRPGNLVFPDHVEVGLQAAKGKNEGDEQTQGADKAEPSDGNVLSVFHKSHNGFRGPVQVQDIQQDRQVVRHEVRKPDGERDRRQKDKQGNHCHQGGVGEARRTGHAVVVQKGLSCNDDDFHESGGPIGNGVEKSFPREIFPPIGHSASKCRKICGCTGMAGAVRGQL